MTGYQDGKDELNFVLFSSDFIANSISYWSLTVRDQFHFCIKQENDCSMLGGKLLTAVESDASPLGRRTRLNP